MLRYSIRELMFFTLAVGLSLGWWLDHRSLSEAKSEAAEDARMLSWLTLPGRIMCGNEAGCLMQIREKYGARPFESTAVAVWEDVETVEHLIVEKSVLLRLIEEVAQSKSQSAVPALLKLLGSMDSDTNTRLASMRALVSIGSSTHEVRRALQTALANDEDRGVRAMAAQGLGTLRFEADQVMPALIAALDDDDEEVRSAAKAAVDQKVHLPRE
jgi:hypothetical protein